MTEHVSFCPYMSILFHRDKTMLEVRRGLEEQVTAKVIHKKCTQRKLSCAVK